MRTTSRSRCFGIAAFDCRKDLPDLCRPGHSTVGRRQRHYAKAGNAAVKPAHNFPSNIVATRLKDDLVEFGGRREDPRRLTSRAISVARRVEVSADDTKIQRNGSLVFVLMLVGFAIEGYALSAMLVHMVPLTQALGLGSAGVVVASLFGPAQVASRLINLVFGGGLSQVWLAVIAAALMPIGIGVLLASNPSFTGAVAFAVLMGLGSGLTSIVGGTLPPELFGRHGYGVRLGWSTSAKQVTSALAPFSMSMSMAGIGVPASLWLVAAAGLAGAFAFALISLILL